MKWLKSSFAALALAGSLSLVPTSSQGGTFEPNVSSLNARLGALPAIHFTSTGAAVASLATDGSSLTAPVSIWPSSNFPVGSGPYLPEVGIAGTHTASFTGVPNIWALWLDLGAASFHLPPPTMAAPPGNFGPGFQRPNPIGPGTIGGFGGVMALRGVWVVAYSTSSEPQAAISIVGGRDLNTSTSMGGHTAMASGIAFTTTNGEFVPGQTLQVTGAPFITGSIQVTDISTDLIHITTGSRAGITGVRFVIGRTNNEMATQITTMDGLATNELETFNVTIWGSKSTTSGVGTVRLIAPMRVTTPFGIGKSPAVVTQTLRFVPEPGSMLLLGSGIVGLLMIAWRRNSGSR